MLQLKIVVSLTLTTVVLLYTWRNRHHTSTPIYQCLDHCLVNLDWCALYPNTKVLNLPIILSDQSPILISTEGQFRKPKQSFKFENWWLLEKYFQNHAKVAWNSTRNAPFSARTNSLACSLKKWCKKKKPIQQELQDIEGQIKQIQLKPLHDQDHDLESSLTQRYEQNLTKLTHFYSQRAKNSGLKMEIETPSISTMMFSREGKNTIVSIKDENDVMHFEPQNIANTFVNYFRYIFSSPNANNGRPFLGTHPPNISDDFTYSILDKQEIFQTEDMTLNASPCPDDFNVEFYIATWR